MLSEIDGRPVSRQTQKIEALNTPPQMRYIVVERNRLFLTLESKNIIAWARSIKNINRIIGLVSSSS